MPTIKDDNNLSALGHDPSKSFIARIIEWSVANKLFVLVGALALLAFGLQGVIKTPLDAIPDLSDTQVIIRADYPGQAPQVIEDQVTYPLSTSMLALPKVKVVRGFSMFGTSFVYIVFDDDTDLYWARSRVLESLSQVTGQMPDGVSPQLGPDATGVGWIYQYAVVDKTGNLDLAQLRTLQDWFLKFELATVPGVAEVASVGGFVKEYQVLIDPNKLRAFNVPLLKVREAVEKSNQEVGGRLLEQAETEYIIRSKGYVQSVEDLEETVVFSDKGIPVRLRDIARVVEGPELRRGVTDLNGEGDVPTGIVVMRPGYNALNVIDDIKAKLELLKPGLPDGVELVPVYDRSKIIKNSVDNLTEKLIEESIVVALVTLIFLLHVRAALVAVITLPLGILGAFIIMSMQGITANIMSLGGIAIAIGAMVDASIVLVENAHRKLSELPKDISKAERTQVVVQAAKEVGPGIFFSLLIITVSFLPVFALTGQSERLFTPLAFTKTYAMAWAAALSITLIPVLMVFMLKGRFYKEEQNPVNRFFVALYKPILSAALKVPRLTILIALVVLLSAAVPLTRLGSEFMPELNEGDLLYMPTTLPGVSIDEARQILQTTNQLIKSVPEVERVWGKAGRAKTATDPAPLSMIETWITLKDKSEWRDGLTMKELTHELNRTVKLPGVVNSWGYPIKIRLDMLTTGIRTPVGIKISGADLSELEKLGKEVEVALKDVPGTRSVFADRVTGGKYIDITPDRRELARRNISIKQFQMVVMTALGGMKLSETVEGRERYSIAVRYDRPFRETPESIRNILVSTPEKAHVPLGELAKIQFVDGPPMIRSEDARLNAWVFVDIEDRDIGSYVEEAQGVIAEKVDFPAGYAISWSGQFEQLQEANKRLSVAIPSAILIIILLLYIHFGRWDRTLIVLSALPFALVGGFWSLYLADYNMSVAAGVGFIALAGVAVETAVVMLIYLDQQVRDHPPQTIKELRQSVIAGSALRVRPKLMTVLTIIFGLLPVFLTEGTGSDVMRRIALPMVGGMTTTLVMTLLLIPVIFELYIATQLKLKKGEPPHETSV